MATSEALSIKSIYAKATALMNRGRSEQALVLFAEIVQRNANIPEVHFQIARIFLSGHYFDKALTHIRAAARLKPGEADIWKVYLDIVRTLSDRKEQQAFREALASSPLDKRQKGALSAGAEFVKHSHVSLGSTSPVAFQRMVAAASGGRAPEAETMVRAELKRNPKTAALHVVLAAACHLQGRQTEAESAVLAALRFDPDYAEAHTTYARILKALGRLPEAFNECNVALRIAPGLPQTLRLRSECYKDLGHPELARADLERAIEIEPANAENYVLLAYLYNSSGDYDAAMQVAKAGIKRANKVFRLYNALAQALSDKGDSEAALEVLNSSMHIFPDEPNVYFRLANLKQSLGLFDEAEADFRTAIERDPSSGETYRVFLMSKKVSLDDPIVAAMQEQFEDRKLANSDRAQFGFALAKAMEDGKRYDEVFKYLDAANRFVRADYPYDIRTRVAEVDRMIESYRTVDWSTVQLASKNSFSPIFVTGMPRSGTTLVEQIIASHSRVTGAGEVGVVPGKVTALLGRQGTGCRKTSSFTTEEYEALGDSYERYMRDLYPDADLVSDKTITTFGSIGILKMAMPNARFIVVRRDPRDNLLSIYKNVFPAGGQLYAYNVKDLAEYHRQFVRLVDYWREVVPDWFYEVQYEDLVANPEEEAPKLIAACGLEWEEACLNFHQNERRVKTLSAFQVRQPMYKSSTRAWERYGDDIRPLLEALGPEYADAAE